MRVAAFTAERRFAPAASCEAASSSQRIPVSRIVVKGSRAKDHAEVCSITRAVILTKIVGRNGYPDYCDQALAFSAILYPASHRHSLRSAFRTGRRRSGLPRSAFIPEQVRLRLSAGGASSASGKIRAPEPGHLPFGPSVTASSACLV